MSVNIQQTDLQSWSLAWTCPTPCLRGWTKSSRWICCCNDTLNKRHSQNYALKTAGQDLSFICGEWSERFRNFWNWEGPRWKTLWWPGLTAPSEPGTGPFPPHPPAPWQPFRSSLQRESFFRQRLCVQSSCCLPSERPFAALPSSLTHPWKRPLFCSCWSRMFSSFNGLGMKPISQPSFTRRPIHQSLLNFYRFWGTWIDHIFTHLSFNRKKW